MKEAFKDHSIFQGMYEYYDEAGKEWRVERDGSHCKFFERSNNCFIHMGDVLLRSATRSIKAIHNRFLDTL